MSVPVARIVRECVAGHYDCQAIDPANLNVRLAQLDGFGHHHSGLIIPGRDLPINGSETQALQTIHDMENSLTLRGMRYIGDITPRMSGFDAGCGLGGSSLMMAKMTGCSMIGASLSEEQVNFANKMAEKLELERRVSFIKTDMTDTRIPPAAFDFVWACESTEHIPLESLQRMFDEFARISKPNARLVIITACGNPNGGEQRELVGQLNDWYKMNLKTPQDYEQHSQTNWSMTDGLNLTQETLPFWRYRTQTSLRTGVEDKVINGYENGAFGYWLFGFDKK